MLVALIEGANGKFDSSLWYLSSVFYLNKLFFDYLNTNNYCNIMDSPKYFVINPLYFTITVIPEMVEYAKKKLSNRLVSYKPRRLSAVKIEV